MKIRYDAAEWEKKARARAHLPIDKRPIALGYMMLLVAVIGIVLMSIDNSIWLGLGLVLGGTILATVIGAWWFNEMSLRNLGKGLRVLDELESIARRVPPPTPTIPPQEKTESSPQVPDTHPPR